MTLRSSKLNQSVTNTVELFLEFLTMYQSKFRNCLNFVFPLVTLFSCGKSSGSKDNIINSNSDGLGLVTQIQSVALNSKNLLSYNSSAIQYFAGQLRTTDRLEVTEFDQAFSSYSLEWKNNVRSIKNSNNSEIDGLTYNINGSVQIYINNFKLFL